MKYSSENVNKIEDNEFELNISVPEFNERELLVSEALSNDDKCLNLGNLIPEDADCIRFYLQCRIFMNEANEDIAVQIAMDVIEHFVILDSLDTLAVLSDPCRDFILATYHDYRGSFDGPLFDEIPRDLFTLAMYEVVKHLTSNYFDVIISGKRADTLIRSRSL
jgi:hypothetical protein